MSQPERNLVRRPCIEHLRKSLKDLKRYDYIYWTCPPDHGKVRPWIAQQMKLDGYEKGVFDLTIIAANQNEVKVWLIEFKYGKNGYTDEQKLVAESCINTPIETIKIYSVDEFKSFLNKNLK